MNAVEHIAALLPPDAARRLAALRVIRFEAVAASMTSTVGRALDVDEARARIVARWGADLCGLLNAMTRGELADVARALRVGDAIARAKSPALRAAVWARGAELERGGAEVGPGVQPRPVLLGGHLVVMAPARGMAPPSAVWPRAVPDPVAPAPPAEEPESLDELLAAADRAVGVRLGPRGRDKGAWGARAAQLLGVVERGADEPDWRGDVEIKTVPVARESSGLWHVVEDPAIAMLGATSDAGGLAKLQRTLWLARASLASATRADDATIVAWYLLDWDAEVARLAKRYLHVRPKGPRASTTFGLYLHKRFFADAGLLAVLNGGPHA